MSHFTLDVVCAIVAALAGLAVGFALGRRLLRRFPFRGEVPDWWRAEVEFFLEDVVSTMVLDGGRHWDGLGATALMLLKEAEKQIGQARSGGGGPCLPPRTGRKCRRRCARIGKAKIGEMA